MPNADRLLCPLMQVKLEQRPCCGNGCRHCPWEHANVPASLKGRCPPPITRGSNAANADGAGT